MCIYIWMDPWGPAVENSATLFSLLFPIYWSMIQFPFRHSRNSSQHSIPLNKVWGYLYLLLFQFSKVTDNISSVSTRAPNTAYVSQLNLQTQFISHIKKRCYLILSQWLQFFFFFLSRFCAMIKKTAPFCSLCVPVTNHDSFLSSPFLLGTFPHILLLCLMYLCWVYHTQFSQWSPAQPRLYRWKATVLHKMA